ncbi:hypothetical protein NDU88_001965 [Pleurodeles waltl]|uniref:Uncharacterized protein n=1 Tax=Pleurodeles waltl TaxID=8319 RepID=A0AAV7U9X0_PLEWA|nr:hypothetical protein NDU88_001965 [Pleurodeles waltl]
MRADTARRINCASDCGGGRSPNIVRHSTWAPAGSALQCWSSASRAPERAPSAFPPEILGPSQSRSSGASDAERTPPLLLCRFSLPCRGFRRS